MKKIITIILGLLVIGITLSVVGGDIFKPSNVKAFGDLLVNFHVPTNAPIFTVANMAPGDPTETRNIDVSNGGTITHLVAVKGVRTGGVGADPKLESVLDLVIKDGSTSIYGTGSATGAKTVADFFTDSAATNGVQLNNIAPGDAKTYSFNVTFPPSAGNDFQAKSVIFNLIFGDGTPPTPTPTKTPTPTPTPSGNLCNSIKVDIRGNGTGTVNGVFIVCQNFRVISQTNITNVNININTSSNTGGNTSTNNTNSSTSITTGSSTNTTTVKVKGGKNKN